MIAVSDRIGTSAEESFILAEELGHHLTAAGNILDQADPNCRRQELRGRFWAYDRLIGLTGIIKAYRYGCRSRYEMAELLGVPENVLQDALDRYRSKYGVCTQMGNYVIYFEPLGVAERR